MGSNDKQAQVLGQASGLTTTTSDTIRIPVGVTVCNKNVPPAAEAVIGQCTYYYRPLHTEYANKDTLDGVREWASQYDWWGQKDVVERLLGKREELIKADSTSPDWSRHANFMMRHIGCGHRPPDYYVSYGYYYCSTYGAQLLPKLSDAGKNWLVDARRFLQKNMEKGLEQNMSIEKISIPCVRFPNKGFTMTAPVKELEIRAELFKAFAYGTHVPAYLDGGLADLPISDLAKIGWQPKANDLYFSSDGLGQAYESGKVVAKHKFVDQPAEAIGKAANDALKRLQSLFK